VNAKAILGCAVISAASLLSSASPGAAATAQVAGKWSISGSMGSSVVTSLSAVCTLRQNADTLAGSCTGPNGGGAAAGNVNRTRVYVQCRVLASNAMGTTGVITLHGALSAPNQLRGTWTLSTRPGVTGTFSATRA
jgi:hypothetical protein